MAVATQIRTWKELCEDPKFRDMPYRIETDRLGKITMSPTRMRHGEWQYSIARLLEDFLPQGRVITECAIKTDDGTKVADVGWYSAERYSIVEDDYDARVAAEICVEVMSPSNTDAEMNYKKDLFFGNEAKEVWICDLEGRLKFYNSKGLLSRSEIAPSFPDSIAK